MNTENLNLKRCLVIQSFAPLFFLLTLKYLDIHQYCRLTKTFVNTLAEKGAVTFSIALSHPSFGGLAVSIIGICWITLALAIALGFKGMQEAGFKAAGEKITIEEVPNDSGATFLVTYVLPLLTDDFESFRGLIVFLVMLMMVIILLANSNTFYQNPVLAAMRYKTFSFKFINPANDISHHNRLYVGITRGIQISEETVIKRKYISDNVFVIYND